MGPRWAETTGWFPYHGNLMQRGKQTGKCGLEERRSVDATVEIKRGTVTQASDYTTLERRGYPGRTQVKQIRDNLQVYRVEKCTSKIV